MDRFLEIRSLNESPGYASIQEKMLFDSGFADEPDLIVALELTISRFYDEKRKTQEKKNKAQQNLKKPNGIRVR